MTPPQKNLNLGVWGRLAVYAASTMPVMLLIHFFEK
jgi:hypothetical protein